MSLKRMGPYRSNTSEYAATVMSGCFDSGYLAEIAIILSNTIFRDANNEL
jgi:hypothetical protein